MESIAELGSPNDSSREASPLAHKLADARRKLVEDFERHHDLSRAEAIARVRDCDNAEFAEQILRRPLRATTWFDLDEIAAVNPELATDRWEAVLDDALAELETGHHAAEAVESTGSDCWMRAQFLAQREQLAGEWEPRDGIELTLIDAMTQALTLKTFWMKRMVVMDALESSDGTTSQLRLPRVSAFQAIEQAAAMTDRFDRMFMRALRQLRDLRRYMPSIVVQRAEQVNVGQQQVNVTAGKDVCDGREHLEKESAHKS